MSICLPNLTLSFFTICIIITHKVEEKAFFALAKGGQQSFGSKRTTFSSRYKMCLFGFLFLGELGTCPQNLMPTKVVEPWENHQFPQRGILDWKSRRWKHALVLPLHIKKLFLKKKKSHFLVVFQSFVFKQILANFGSFWQNWVEFVALTVAESMHEARLKSSKHHNS
jgi:hypothetical protein